MSEHESDVVLFHSTNPNIQTKIYRTKIFLKLLSNGHIFVDWSDLPKHKNTRQCVIHYKSLNNNRSHAIRVSRQKRNVILEKIESGHLYEIHVCTVDESNRIIASSERAQIQTIMSNEAPTLRVTKSTPDFITLEWEKSNDVKLSDIELYKLIINGNSKAMLPSTENKFVVNDGKFGKRYVFRLEMTQKDQKIISSLPVNVDWPGVTMPKLHAFVNGTEELIICWGDSRSINDGNIESYMLHLYDSEGRLLNQFGPNSAECRQVWIKDMIKGVYFYVLEIKLANSNKSIYSKPMKIECGRESSIPILTCDYSDANNQKRLVNMAYHLINIRDNMKSKRLFEKCENQLKRILSTLNDLTDSVHLNLTIESKSNDNIPRKYYLIIDGQENPAPMPCFVKDFPLELPRRDKPYALAVSVTPALYGTKSNTVLVEASDHFSFFCAHFHQQRSIESCSYIQTLSYEKQLARSMHQGLIKSPKMMTNIQVYDLNENKIVSLPLLGNVHRLTIILFYINGCIPSKMHLNYFSTYASSHCTKYNFISINCNQNDIDDLKNFTENLTDIQCYTDFSSEDFKYEQKENKTSLHELLSIDGVPSYFVLDFSGHVVWKGRLCISNQLKYDSAMDHIIARVNQLQCSTENCELCYYSSMNDTCIDSELNNTARNLQLIIQQRLEQYGNKQLEKEKHNRTRQIVSMKQKSTEINDNEYYSII
ncbi:unnamed protein product [Rotaria sordida]|uniref:Uncharacterized protein n=1 Tax=Rotaria sordida TaxID=392033 RepID=A0A815CMI1_9BILA|nr:unnamed protein product [Rotaria sordida]